MAVNNLPSEISRHRGAAMWIFETAWSHSAVPFNLDLGETRVGAPLRQLLLKVKTKEFLFGSKFN